MIIAKYIGVVEGKLIVRVIQNIGKASFEGIVLESTFEGRSVGSLEEFPKSLFQFTAFSDKVLTINLIL